MAKLIQEIAAVYTTAPASVIEAALAYGGQGTLTENKRWSTAHAALQVCREDGLPYPLLLADASSIEGVVWVAEVLDITVHPEGHSTVRFRNLRELPRLIRRSALHKRSDGQPLSEDYIRPYVPCFLRGAVASQVQKALLAAAQPKPLADERAQLSVGDFVRALQAVEASLSPAQRAMLCAHAQASDGLLDMQAIATAGGYSQFRAANIHYAAVGRMLGEAIELANMAGPTGILALGSPLRSARGHFQWVLREPLRQALVELGWVTSTARLDDHWRVGSASLALEADPRYREAAATTRQALVAARLGQGAYRADLLALWGGRCALTGCDLTAVLVASHAKPWQLSTNAERLDPYNGLLLAAHVDKLFDVGLIAFAKDGRLLRKPEVSDAVLRSLGLVADSRVLRLHARHLPYLAAHRDLYGFNSAA
jgi:hypothetical protein